MATENISPTGAGNYTEWNTSGCASNYECVDDPVASPDDATTRVQRSAVSAVPQKDTYSFANPSSIGGSDTINHVKIYFRIDTSDAGSPGPTMRPMLRISATDYFGTTREATTTWTTWSDTWTTNPNTTAAWTLTEVNALEAGFELVATNSKQARVTQIYAEIDYTVAGGTIPVLDEGSLVGGLQPLSGGLG